MIATLPYVAAVCAGLWLGLLAPQRTFRQLLVLAAASALGFGLLNLAHEQFVGPVDFSGAFGHLLVVGMSFPLILVLCLVGGAVGSALRRAMRA